MRELAVLGVLAFGAPAFADLIHACVHDGKGKLRLVSDASLCTRNERAISWSAQGPAGETGPPGEPGLPGESLGVFDANGQKLGLWMGLSVEGMSLFEPSSGSIVRLDPFTGELSNHDRIALGHVTEDCSDPGFANGFNRSHPQIAKRRFDGRFVGLGTAEPSLQTFVAASGPGWPGDCFVLEPPVEGRLVEVEEVPPPDLELPAAAPLRVEVEASGYAVDGVRRPSDSWDR